MHADPKKLPITSWTLITRASGQDQEALAELLKLYFPALKTHLITRKGIEFHEAEDIVQSFVMRKVLGRSLLATARKERGRFRTYVLHALENYCIDWWRGSKKRLENEAVGLDGDLALTAAAGATNDGAETEFAAEVVHEAIRQTRDHCEHEGLEASWEIFDVRVLAPILRDEPAAEYSVLLKKFGLKSPRDAANRLTTAKRIFARTLRNLVDGYVCGGPEDIDTEIQDLKKLLDQPTAGRGDMSEKDKSHA